MPWQAARDRVNTEAHSLARCTQFTHQIAHCGLRLGHSHAVARHDNHAIGIVQGTRYAAGVNCHLLAFDLRRWALAAAKAA